MDTQYAPADRDPQEKVAEQTKEVNLTPLFSQIFNAVPHVLMVLNDKRQIVFSNRALLDLLGASDLRAVCGRRPGEILECTNSALTDGGCSSLYAGLARGTRAVS